MNIEKPFDHIREIFRISNKENRELMKYVFEKSDSISLWIIGLSVGGISIIANNLADIQKAICPCLLRPILILLAISVSSGIIYRGLYLYLFVILNKISQGIDIALSKQKTMPTESHLIGNETFEELIDKLKEGFGDDLSYLIPAYTSVDDKAKTELFKSVVDHYLKSIEFAQTNMSNGIDFIADTYSKFYGGSKETILNKLNKSSAIQYKLTIIFSTLFYFIYILSFIAALFIFVYAT